MQTYACGELANREEIKNAILASAEIEVFEPSFTHASSAQWDDAYARVLSLTQK